MGDTLYLYTSTNMAAAAPKVKKAKVHAAHPPYASMITAAIKALGDKKGSSRQAILKYVVANNKVDAAKAAVRVRIALKKMIASVCPSARLSVCPSVRLSVCPSVRLS